MSPAGPALSGVVTRYAVHSRVLDVVLTLLIVPVVAPAALLIALAVALDSPGPVLFRSTRVGRDGRRFRMIKFRTMRHLTPGPRITSAEDRRHTPLGRLLAISRLDEIPQLWNVLRGDMRLVGPRPELEAFVAEQPESYRQILSVPPGVTGRTQLVFADEGRLLAMAEDPESFYVNDLLPNKVQLDLRYVARSTPLGDLAILAQTWLVPFRRLAKAGGEYPRSARRASLMLAKAATLALASMAMIAMFALEGAAAF